MNGQIGPPCGPRRRGLRRGLGRAVRTPVFTCARVPVVKGWKRKRAGRGGGEAVSRGASARGRVGPAMTISPVALRQSEQRLNMCMQRAWGSRPLLYLDASASSCPIRNRHRSSSELGDAQRREDAAGQDRMWFSCSSWHRWAGGSCSCACSLSAPFVSPSAGGVARGVVAKPSGCPGCSLGCLRNSVCP